MVAARTAGLSELARFDATAQLHALAARRISALELLEASLARERATAETINAVVQRDPEHARARARQIDDLRAKGETAESLGLLAGLPMTLKDTLDVDGMPASAGVRGMAERGAGDSSAAGRVRTEGAVLWGKTNTPAMAQDWQTWNDLYGATANPWDTSLTPGGSSGGAAAALAAGITALEVGSDLAGSLRIPASFCGLFGHRPTYGLASQRGHVPPAPGNEAEMEMLTVGPMARSARDVRLLLSILAGAAIPARSPPALLNGAKIALWLDEPAFALDPAVRAAVEAFAAKLSDAGVIIEPLDRSPVAAEPMIDAFAFLALTQVAEPRPGYGLLRPAALVAERLGTDRLSWASYVLAATAPHAQWRAANEARARFSRQMRGAFAHHDAILAPIAATTAFPHDHGPMGRRRLAVSDGGRFRYSALFDWIALASLCGLPATALPAGLSAEGLPVGVQLIGPAGADSKLLALAQAIDESIGGFVPPPTA